MTVRTTPELGEVFGIRITPVLSYVTRQEVDGAFQRAIETEHHIVVYGSSKQGKTALRQKHVADADCVVIRCSPRHTTVGLYSSMLRQANVQIQTLGTESRTLEGKTKGSVGFLAKIPWVGGGETKIEAEAGASKQQTFQTDFIAYDFGDAQAISELLVGVRFQKFVVLENFHYLTEETQRQLAFDLKTFHEVGVRFIILGIWQEANLLTTHNGDLQDRVLEVKVEPWEAEDFGKVAATGACHLNVDIADSVVALFIENAYGNVGMLQEFLKHFCEKEGVPSRQEAHRLLESLDSAKLALKEKLETQRVSLVKALQAIAARSRIRSGEGDPLLLPYYMVLVILKQPMERLREGILRDVLLTELRQVHHRANKDTVRGSDLTNLLVKLPQYQEGIQPPLLYYDNNSRRLKIVDTRQFFVLAGVDRGELADEIPSPGAD